MLSALLIIGAAVSALVVGVWLYRRHSGAPSYAQILSPAHVLELGGILPGIKAAALAEIELGDSPAEKQVREVEPRRAITSAGLRILYTITSVQDRFIHHYSLSVGEYTPHAVGRTFALVVARLLGLDAAKLEVARSSNSIWHIVFELSAEEQQGFGARAPLAVNAEEAEAIFAESFRDGHKLDLDHPSLLPAAPQR
ncbi:MAG: hypothetical protein U1E65_20130 [Myxococcota bacterium]